MQFLIFNWQTLRFTLRPSNTTHTLLLMSDLVFSECFLGAMRNQHPLIVALTVPTWTYAAMRLFASTLNTLSMLSFAVIFKAQPFGYSYFFFLLFGAIIGPTYFPSPTPYEVIGKNGV